MNIAVCQFSTSNVPYRNYTIEINKEYCKKYNYRYYVEIDDNIIIKKLDNRSTTWYKPHLIKECMKRFANCQYIVFLDIDAVFTNHDRSIEEYLQNSFEVLMTRDHGPSLVNAGVMIVKNSMFVYTLMSRWWDIGEEHPEYKTGLWHDQTCLKYLYDELEDKSVFKIIDNIDINSRIYNKKCLIFHAFSYGSLENRTLDVVYNSIFNINSKYETLSEIAKKYPTDKDFTHNYFDSVYEKYFSPIKENVKNICEIGVGGFWEDVGWVPGNSLRVWKDYFTNAKILGLDKASFTIKTEDRITVDWIDQSDKQILEKYVNNMDYQDIIIDDGSHNMHDQQVTFSVFIKKLKEGGIYVIEDLHSSIEVKIPEKRNVWGWGDENVITTLEMLQHFKKTGKIVSDYLSEEEKVYLENNIESIDIFSLSPTSITSIIKKNNVTKL